MLTLWRRPDRRTRQPLPLLKKLFWLYFFLLVFEGALRKWILPQYSAPLLLIRDPVGFWILALPATGLPGGSLGTSNIETKRI